MFIVFLSFSSIYCWCIIYTFVCYIKYRRSFWYLTVSFDVYLINLCLCRVKLTDPSLNQIYSSLLLKVGYNLSRLGLQVNWEKSKFSPVQRISFLGMELDSVNLTARLSLERAQSLLNCLESLQHKRAVPLKYFQMLLGHMASAVTVTPLRLLHMRPLQLWLQDRAMALAMVKRVGDPQAFSVDDSCLGFGPGNSHVVLRLRLGYVPKIPTTPFRDQVVNLQALPRE